MDRGSGDRLSLVKEESEDASENSTKAACKNEEAQPVSSGSTLKYEQTTETSSTGSTVVHVLPAPQQLLRKCEFCRKPVLPNKDVKSCVRSDGVVHAGCADLEQRYELKRAAASERLARVMNIEEQHECVICQRVRFERKEGEQAGIVLREDQRWIKPCFCLVYAHHGCLAGVVEQRRECSQCGVPYAFRVYGSFVDFISRYWISYCMISSVIVFFCVVAVYTMAHTYAYPVPSWPSGRIALLIVGLFLSSVAMCCLGGCLRYTFGTRVPRFKSKYRCVRVSNYTPRPLTGSELLRRNGAGRRGDTNRQSTSLLLTQVPRKDSKTRSLLSFTLPNGEDSELHDYQYTSTPKVGSASIPFDFSFQSQQQHRSSLLSPRASFRRPEEHPLRLTLERVLEEDESSHISYDDTHKDMRQ